MLPPPAKRVDRVTDYVSSTLLSAMVKYPRGCKGLAWKASRSGNWRMSSNLIFTAKIKIMILEENINGLVFVEQRTFYIYKSEEDRKKGNYSFVTSDESLFLTHKENLRNKLSVIRDEKIDKVL